MNTGKCQLLWPENPGLWAYWKGVPSVDNFSESGYNEIANLPIYIYEEVIL